METRKIKIEYPLARLGEPIITRLVTEFDILPNLLRADVDAHQGGWMIAELSGDPESIGKALEWMGSHGLTISEG